MNNYALFTQALLNYPITEIAEKLSLHIGTLARWKQQTNKKRAFKRNSGIKNTGARRNQKSSTRKYRFSFRRCREFSLTIFVSKKR